MAVVIVVEIVLYMPVALFPKVVTAPRMTRKIRETMRPYSMAVAPA